MDSIYKELKDRTVIITGADGFIGSHVADKCVECGAKVHALIRASSSGELNNINHIKDKIIIHRGDLTDIHYIHQTLKKIKETDNNLIVFHLAAQAHVGESWERPYETVYSNIIGTLNLLQTIIDTDMDVYKFDTAGTSEEYGNIRNSQIKQHEYDSIGKVIFSERSPLNPKSIYATSKVAADFLTMNYYDAYGLPGVVTRMFNNYGPRQNPRYITGTVITQALKKEKIILGNLSTERDMCFVEDGVRGHIHVALKGKPGQVYCYGQGKNISMKDWAELIIKTGKENNYWKNREIISEKNRYRPGDSDVKRLKVGYEKLNSLTGWKPEYTWEQGVERTIRWYKDNEQKWMGKVDWK